MTELVWRRNGETEKETRRQRGGDRVKDSRGSRDNMSYSTGSRSHSGDVTVTVCVFLL